MSYDLAGIPNPTTHELPPHLRGWELPPDWRWGGEGRWGEHRHYQEVVDALGRSLALVSAQDAAHATWLAAEARHLAHLNHPSIPTTYHFWSANSDARRGPGYLRRWLSGETIGERLAASAGGEGAQYSLQLLRAVGSPLAYLHAGGTTHGAVSPHTVWASPGDRLWLLGWEWGMPHADIPEGYRPDQARMLIPPEWTDGRWLPTPESDQWQLAATAFATLSGERVPAVDMPPIDLVCPECPRPLAAVLERALSRDPARRYPTMSALLRSLDHAVGTRTSMGISGSILSPVAARKTEEGRLRWALGEDYEVRSRLGAGTFGSVWRVRDLTLEREVALKMLHPEVAGDTAAVRRFRREAQLAGQLAHPAIVPVYDWDSNAGVSWYTMELAEGGSVAELVRRAGARPLTDVAAPIEQVLDGLAVAHSVGVIHRDLKPENILIDRYRRWRISDFGVARVSGEEAAGTTGTPEFAAPEQLLGETQGPAVDCFGVGAITAFVLTGRLPFGSGDGRVILARQLARQLDLAAVPPEVAEWLRRALDPSPEARFADAAAMRDAWRAAAATALGRDQHAPWWRRWLHGDEATVRG